VQKLILARHGESEYSARGLVNGDVSVHVGLTESGREQARGLGRRLAGERLDLCVTSELARTAETARLALRGRDVTVEVWPDLNDPRAGAFEGRHLDEYRRWAWTSGSAEDAPGGGESRRAVVLRYAGAYARLLARPEGSILAVLHALPIAYALLALEGTPPAPRVDRAVAPADPHVLTAGELRDVLGVLEAWCCEPTW
jgi:broad specificity phosphatase PhoE